MTTAGAHIAAVLDQTGRAVLDQLGAIPAELLNRPLPLPETNTLFALATHLAGSTEFWVLEMAGGQARNRDRPAEFRASGTLADLTMRYEGWIAAVHAVLDPLSDAALDRVARPTGNYRDGGGLADGTHTARECLLHAVAHASLHLGHIEITRQLLTAAPGAPVQ